MKMCQIERKIHCYVWPWTLGVGQRKKYTSNLADKVSGLKYVSLHGMWLCVCTLVMSLSETLWHIFFYGCEMQKCGITLCCWTILDSASLVMAPTKHDSGSMDSGRDLLEEIRVYAWTSIAAVFLGSG